MAVGEHINYRYIVDKVCGEGAFGQVLLCRDMSDNERKVALKISKNQKSESQNAHIESKILKKIA